MQEDINYSIDADVVVIGGGPAGLGAAMAASRQGLKVSLLESGSSIGGIMATCPGMPIGNLLFAGRCISADSVALASVRGMATCMGLG
jgi:thioredoxin reductase